MITFKNHSLWTSDEIGQALGVPSKVSWSATGVSIDTRTMQPGDLFIAIVGPINDGHEFVIDAFKASASAAIVHKSVRCSETPIIYVENTMNAMETLAHFSRVRSKAKIIGITGSVGKTGIKEMLRLVLSEQALVAATEGNLNNHWGLPLSLMRMPKTTEIGIFEMGMSGPGEIQGLSNIALPDISIITTIQNSHKEFFQSVHGIVNEKAKIASGMTDSGIVLINRDDLMYKYLKTALQNEGVDIIKTFGCHLDSDFRLLQTKRLKCGQKVIAKVKNELVEFDLGLLGRHWAINSIAVLAAVDLVGGDVRRAAFKLRDMVGIKGRGDCKKVYVMGGEALLIDESYNASPASMEAAINVLGEYIPKRGGRRIAVLGDMLELGEDSADFHEALIKPLQLNNIDLVFMTGVWMAVLWEILPKKNRGAWSESACKLSPIVSSSIRADDVVMIKGSQGSKTGIIVSNLENQDGSKFKKLQEGHQ